MSGRKMIVLVALAALGTYASDAAAQAEVHSKEINVYADGGDKGDKGDKGPHGEPGGKGDSDKGGSDSGKGAGGKSPIAQPKAKASQETLTKLQQLISEFVSDVLVSQAILGQNLINAALHATGIKEQDLVSVAHDVGQLSEGRRAAFRDNLREMLIEAKTPGDREAIRGVLDIVQHPEKYKPGSFKIENQLLHFNAAVFQGAVFTEAVSTGLTQTFYDKMQQAVGSEGADSRFGYLAWESPWLTKIGAHAVSASKTPLLTLTPHDRAMMREALYSLDIADGIRLQIWANRQRQLYPDQAKFLSLIDISGAWTSSGLDVEYWYPLATTKAN